MWDNSEFDNGGGFFNSNQVDSPSRTGKKDGEEARRLQSVVPVCVRQIRDHPEDEFKLFGMATQILTVVGILKEYEVQSTKATYVIEDHTGTISAMWWIDNDMNIEPNLPLVKEGCYLRIYGSLRMQEGQKTLLVMRMFPVDNINEVTNHLLQVIHVRLEAEAISKGPGLTAQIRANNPGAELVNSMSFMNSDVGLSDTGLTPIQDKVFKTLQSVNSIAGLSRKEILDKFPSHQHREVNAALEFLMDEGHAYSTIDNEHFKVTDSL